MLCESEGACLIFDDVVFFALGAHLLFRSSNQKPDSKAETEDNENLHPQSTCQEGGLKPSESPNKVHVWDLLKRHLHDCTLIE